MVFAITYGQFYDWCMCFLVNCSMEESESLNLPPGTIPLRSYTWIIETVAWCLTLWHQSYINITNKRLQASCSNSNVNSCNKWNKEWSVRGNCSGMRSQFYHRPHVFFTKFGLKPRPIHKITFISAYEYMYWARSIRSTKVTFCWSLVSRVQLRVYVLQCRLGPSFKGEYMF